MSEHSRLDYILSAVENDADYPMSIHIAKAELAALRARVAELEQRRQRREFDAGVIDGLNVAIKIKDERIAELEAAQAATLTPRRDTLDKVWMHVVKFESPLSYNNSGDVCEMIIGGDDMIGIQDAAEVIKQSLTQAVVMPNNCRHCQQAAEQMREAAAEVFEQYVHALRWDKAHALGLGDVRVTIGQCEEIAQQIRALKVSETCPNCHKPIDDAQMLCDDCAWLPIDYDPKIFDPDGVPWSIDADLIKRVEALESKIEELQSKSSLQESVEIWGAG